jgi:hypothetical protein
MKYKQLKIILSLFLLFGLTVLQAQTLQVKLSNGTETAYSLGNISKISFPDGNMEITNLENFTSNYELNELRYLSFSDSDIISAISETEKFTNNNFAVFPNPVSDVLTIQFKDLGNNKSRIEILAISGKIISTQDVTGMQTARFDLSHLPNGIYLCRFIDSSTSKTIKIIKY